MIDRQAIPFLLYIAWASIAIVIGWIAEDQQKTGKRFRDYFYTKDDFKW